MTIYTTPSKVNKALAEAFEDVKIIRGKGYYFDDTTTAIRSIYEWPRLSSTPNEIVEYVRDELAHIKG